MSPLPLRAPVNYLLSAIVCALTTLVAFSLLPFVNLANIVMLFLLTVFLIAVYFGRGAGVFASFLSVASFDFFCVNPRFTFAVDDAQYLLTFVVMLAVALITGQLAAKLRIQADLAKKRAARAQALYEMAQSLSGAIKLSQVCEITADFLRRETGLESVLLLPNEEDELLPATQHVVWYESHIAWAAFEGKHPHMLTEPDGLYYLPLKGTTRMRGVLVLAVSQSAGQELPALSDENKEMLWAFASLVAIAVERLHYVEIAKQNEMQITTERLRSSILSALSHDLRTPLTVLVGMADSLANSKPALSNLQQAIAQTICDQSIHLSGMVTNLLDMARLQAGKVEIHKEWQPLEEVIGASIKLLTKTLEHHSVKVNLPVDLPMLAFDAVLMERVFCNLLENAAKYSPQNAPIDISACLEGDFVKVTVRDYGVGILAEKISEIFGMFVRGQAIKGANNIAGTGIGLAVCRAIIEAHQGTINAENLLDGGASFSFTLPLGDPPLLDEAQLEGELI